MSQGDIALLSLMKPYPVNPHTSVVPRNFNYLQSYCMHGRGECLWMVEGALEVPADAN